MLRLLLLLLLAAPVAAADPAPEPKRVPDVAAFPTEFAAALGEHFEFLGGEKARIRCSMGTYAAERFWVAKVRAKTPGRYTFGYRSTFHFPEFVTKQWGKGGDAEYTFRVAIGKTGGPRVFHPGGFGGSAFPYANAGDTLLVPVHADPFRIDHRFAVKRLPDDDPAFNVIGEDTAARYLRLKSDPPVVRNLAADRLTLLSGWVSSDGNRPGTATHHTLGAFLEFATPGEFSIGGRLAAKEAADEGVPFRVLPKDRPVTVVLDSLGYVETNGKTRFSMSSGVRPGTLEARVGDRVAVGCGDYHTPGLGGADPAKTGVVEVRPFRDVPAYAPR